MISAFELHFHASRTLNRPSSAEVDVRRAVSSLYYGLFHRLTTSGAALFEPGGAALRSQVARTYDHGAMRRVCEAYGRSLRQPFPAPLANLVQGPAHPALAAVADAFVRLQIARHAADYDLAASFTLQDGLDLLDLADAAHASFTAAEPLPATTVFLTALLLSDRWTRRG